MWSRKSLTLFFALVLGSRGLKLLLYLPPTTKRVFFIRLLLLLTCKFSTACLSTSRDFFSLVLGDKTITFLTLLSLVWRRSNNVYAILMSRCLLFVGSLKKLLEVLAEEENIDYPALFAMELGMLLGHEDASLVILLMLTGGEILEDYALSRAQQSFSEILESTPKLATKRLSSGNFEEVSIERIRPNDIILVKCGTMIPVDGILVEEGSDTVVEVNEQALTGEMLPEKKVNGSSLYAGTYNISQTSILLKTKVVWTESLYYRLQGQIRSCLESKSSLHLQSIERSSLFSKFTFGLVAISYIFHSRVLKKTEIETWKIILSVLMAATPCPLQIGVPVTFLAGMSNISKRFSCSITSAASLEQLALVDCVVLDKTGTITTGFPTVKRIDIFSGGSLSASEVAQILVSVEKHSSHPLALSLCRAYKDIETLPTSNIVETPGKGIEGRVAFNERILMVSIGADVTNDSNDEHEELGSNFHIEDVNIKGRIVYSDTIRDGIGSMVKSFNEDNIPVYVLSGDRTKNLARVSKAVGIEEYKSCWPHEKTDYIEALLEADKTVLMVGDGINDSAALLTANVGVAVGSGGLAATAADIVLLKGDSVASLYQLIEKSKSIILIARQTVNFGMSLACLQMFAAASGILSPFYSACLQEFIDLSTVLYALSALFR